MPGSADGTVRFTTTVTACSDSVRVIKLNVQDFYPLVYHEHPGATLIMQRLGRSMTQRLAQTEERLQQLLDVQEDDDRMSRADWNRLRKNLMRWWALRFHKIGRKGKLEVGGMFTCDVIRRGLKCAVEQGDDLKPWLGSKGSRTESLFRTHALYESRRKQTKDVLESIKSTKDKTARAKLFFTAASGRWDFDWDQVASEAGSASASSMRVRPPRDREPAAVNS